MTVSPGNIIANEGQTVKLQCQAAGYPTPSITVSLYPKTMTKSAK